MPSTSRQRYTAYAAHALLFLAMSSTVYADDLKPMTYKGCYSSSSGLTKNDEYLYQTSGYCQPKCVNQNDAVLATSNGDECWCGNALPPSGSKVDDSKCNTPCTGFGTEDCGGNGYYSVYLTGVGTVESENSSPSSTNTATATVASPSVVTQTSPGKTLVVTESPASSSSSASSDSKSSGGGVNTTAVAAGVVVAVVIISGIVAAVFFWLRYRRRQAAEDEYKRTQVSDFIGGGKPPQTGYSSMSDSRLDPEFGNKRNSHGSIADNEDFSRKILRVANPDRSGH